jgi:crotonobetainyl-CoA:carnitine CoA-transferase CaiB-like acyl-CoA transferase
MVEPSIGDWFRFCQAVEREDLEHDPRFETFEAKRENRIELYHILKKVFLGKNLDEWKPRLKGIPYAAFQSLLEVINDPQARANNFFVPMDHPAHGRIEVVASPIKLSRTPASIRMPGPELGQHTEEVILELGYTWENIARFKQQNTIA